MNIAKASIQYRTVTLVVTLLCVLGGMMAYQKLGRLEDPEFTIKEAQVFTLYPGATAAEVSDEVTDVIETAVQQMGQLKLVTSISEAGKSTVLVEMKDKYDKDGLPQVWDELRRKVADAQSDLPEGAKESVVYDDFGDVYGVFFCVYGDGYSNAELYEYAKLLRRELLLVQDVAKISITGRVEEAIYLEVTRERLTQLGITLDQIKQTLSGQNDIVDGGKVRVDDLYLRVQPSGELQSIADIGELLILQSDGKPSKLRIKDIGVIRRGYIDPPTELMRYNGHPSIGIGISTVEGGNVVTMGDGVRKRMQELLEQTPIGIEFGAISIQSEAVTVAVNGFVISLIEAIAIVVGILMFAMGFRSGLLIGFILLLTVLATLIVMQARGVMLERISLGALIIALGMLVDNAIVVVEGIIINRQKGMEPTKAASAIVQQTTWPLFGATVVAVLAFAAIGASQDSTGEYCRSLFLVILFSLMLSWILAITVTPLLGVMFLKVKPQDDGDDPYGGIFFKGYRGFLVWCLKLRWLTVAVLIGALLLSVYGFGFVSKSFFPPSTRPQFMVHYWLPQGTHIARTDADLKRLTQELLESDDLNAITKITNVTAFAGKGSLRFLLTYSAEDANTAYGMLLVDVEDYTKIDALRDKLQEHLAERYPDALAYSRKFVLGPGDPAKIHARFRGSDPTTLRHLADACKQLMHEHPNATDIYDDWRARVPMVRPVINEATTRNAGLTRRDIALTLQGTFEGRTLGHYRENDELIPIIGRPIASERKDVDNLMQATIWSPVAEGRLPIGQFVNGYETVSEDTLIRRRNRLPTITVKCDPLVGEAVPVFQELRGPIEAMFESKTRELGLSGYTLEWGGEYEDSGDAQAALASKIPVIGVLIFLVVICLFNAIRQPLMIFLTVPLALIGVTAGLLLMNQPFGFMALLGFMSLAGMLIKNAIVLIDEINAQIGSGKDHHEAIIDSGVSRLRPVSMAALTTVLGMIPLLTDAFFVAMAVTIMFGLTFATILTLVVIPVLYAIMFRIHPSDKKA